MNKLDNLLINKFWREMEKVVTLILENKKGDILMYLRDNKNTIPFPNHWDLFGGHIEEGETNKVALKREIKEELGIDLKDFRFFKEYKCLKGDTNPNIKYVYFAKLSEPVASTTKEGQQMRFISPSEIPSLQIANILKDIILDYLKVRYK